MGLLTLPNEVLGNVVGFLDVQSTVKFAECSKHASSVVNMLLNSLWHSMPLLEEWVQKDIEDRTFVNWCMSGMKDQVRTVEEYTREEKAANDRQRAKLELTVWSEFLGNTHLVLEVISRAVHEEDKADSVASESKTAKMRVREMSSMIRGAQDMAEEKL